MAARQMRGHERYLWAQRIIAGVEGARGRQSLSLATTMLSNLVPGGLVSIRA